MDDLDSDQIEVERKRSNPVAKLSSRMESLPRDLILCILSRLPISSFVQLKSVCTGWCMLARDPDLVNKYSTTCMEDENNTCLIYPSDCAIRNQLHFVDFPASNHEEKKVKWFHIEPFSEATPVFYVLGSSNGMLCLSANDALYVYNPFTGNYRDLPKSTQFPSQEDVVYGFGFHPTTKEYKVLKIVYYRKADSDHYSLHQLHLPTALSEVQIFTLGSSTCRSLETVGYFHHLYQWHSQVLVNGKLHWKTWPRRYHRGIKIFSFDLAEEQFLRSQVHL